MLSSAIVGGTGAATAGGAGVASPLVGPGVTPPLLKKFERGENTLPIELARVDVGHWGVETCSCAATGAAATTPAAGVAGVACPPVVRAVEGVAGKD